MDKAKRRKPSVMVYAAQRRNVEMMNLVGLTGVAEALNGALMNLLLDGNEPMATDDEGWEQTVVRLAQDIPELDGYGGEASNVWTFLLGSLSPDNGRRRGASKLRKPTLPRHVPHVAHYLGNLATGFLYDFAVASALRDLAAVTWAYSLLLDDLDSENTRGLRQRYADFFGSAEGLATGESYESRLDWVVSLAAPEAEPVDVAEVKPAESAEAANA